MKHILAVTLLTGVYLLLGSGVAQGQVQGFSFPYPTSSRCGSAPDSKAPQEEKEKYNKCLKEEDSKKDCDIKLKDFNKASKDFSDACSKSGLEPGKCRKAFEECSAAFTGEEEADPVVSIPGMLNLPNFEEVKKRCPTFGESVKDLEKDFKDSKKEFDDITKESHKSEKDSADRFSKLQKEISEVQEQHSKDQVKVKDETRKAEADRASTLANLTSDIEKTNADILKANTAHAKMLGDQAQNMSSLSNAMIQIKCEDAISKLASNLKLQQTTSGSSMVKSGANKTKKIKDSYNQCIDQALALRSQMVETFKNQEIELNNSIQRMNTDIGRKKDQLTLFQQQAAAAAQDAQAANNAMEQKYQQDLMRLSNQLQNMNTTTAKESAAINQKLSAAKADYVGKSSSLGSIKPGFKNTTQHWSEVPAAHKAYKTAGDDYRDQQCCKIKPNTLPTVCDDKIWKSESEDFGTSNDSKDTPGGKKKDGAK